MVFCSSTGMKIENGIDRLSADRLTKLKEHPITEDDDLTEENKSSRRENGIWRGIGRGAGESWRGGGEGS